MIEGLFFAHKTTERGLVWNELDIGPDLSAKAWIAPMSDDGRAVYLRSGDSRANYIDAELSRCELQDRIGEIPSAAQTELMHVGDDHLMAVAFKKCALAPCDEGDAMIIALPPVIVVLGTLTLGMGQFIRSAGYDYRPEFLSGAVFTKPHLSVC